MPKYIIHLSRFQFFEYPSLSQTTRRPGRLFRYLQTGNQPNPKPNRQTDKEIDQQVYQLYELMEEEIGIGEGSVK